MPAPDEIIFDDPRLKSALRTALGGETAPPALAERIRRQITAQSDGSVAGRIDGVARAHRGKAPWRSGAAFHARPFFAWATAAMLLIGLSIVGVHFWNTGRAAQAATAPLPDALAAALVFRHDSCCRPGNPHRGDSIVTGEIIPQRDLPGMERVLHRDLQHGVMVADLQPDGWKFRGAAECQVEKTISAHLIYDRDGGSISIFSLPAAMFPHARDGTRFAAVYHDHPIVGVVSNGAIFCMVQSQPGTTPSIDNLKKLFWAHEAESSVALASPLQNPSTPRAEARRGELLHEIANVSLARR